MTPTPALTVSKKKSRGGPARNGRARSFPDNNIKEADARPETLTLTATAAAAAAALGGRHDFSDI